MSSALTIPQFFPTEFANNWESVVQNKGGKVTQFATPDPSFKGKKKWYNQIDAEGDFDVITTRMGPTVLGEITGDKYWMTAAAYDKAKGFDEWDDAILGDIALPNSETIQELAKAWQRQIDTKLLSEVAASRYIGEDGTTADALGSGQQVAVDYKRTATAANSGMTYEKFLRMLEIFGGNGVDFSDEGMPTMFLRMRQITDLYASVDEFRNTDYAVSVEPFDKTALITRGNIVWHGVNICHSELIPTTGSSIYQVPVFCKRGLKYFLETPSPMIDIRSDLKHALQIRMKGRLGAVRTQNELVVEISCDETA